MAKTGELQIGSVTVPTFELDDFNGGVYPLVQTNSGYIPFTSTSEAQFQSVRVSTQNHGTLAAHSEPNIGPDISILLEEDFSDSSLSSNWTTFVAGDTNRDIARIVDGKLYIGMKGDNLCADPAAYAEYPLGDITGTLDISFWSAFQSDGYWEDTKFAVYEDDERILYEVPHDRGYSTRIVETYKNTLDVDGNVTLRWEIGASNYCDIGDHEWTRMEVDNILVKLTS